MYVSDDIPDGVEPVAVEEDLHTDSKKMTVLRTWWVFGHSYMQSHWSRGVIAYNS